MYSSKINKIWYNCYFFLIILKKSKSNLNWIIVQLSGGRVSSINYVVDFFTLIKRSWQRHCNNYIIYAICFITKIIQSIVFVIEK